MGFLGKATATAKLANYYRSKGEFVDAVSNSLGAINLFDSLHLTKKRIKAQLVLSTIYKEMGGERGTIDYLNKAYLLAKELVEVPKNRKELLDPTERGRQVFQDFVGGQILAPELIEFLQAN